MGNGLQGLDPHTGKFTQYTIPGEDSDRIYISSICIGRDKNLYMATSNGIVVFSPTTKTFGKWLGNKKGTQKFLHPNINDLFEDSRGLLWIATAEGLNIYDRKNDKIISLGNEIIQAIVEDNNKNMLSLLHN